MKNEGAKAVLDLDVRTVRERLELPSHPGASMTIITAKTGAVANRVLHRLSSSYDDVNGSRE